MRFLLCLLLVAATNAVMQVRVSPALGSHGRNMARISVIDNNGTNTYDNFFDYNEQFMYKWTDNALHTVLKEVQSGSNTFHIGTQEVNVRFPAANAPVRGFIFGDPCITATGFDVPCVSDVEHRLPEILNSVSHELDFWTILGDNFYDRTGHISARFFGDLSLESMSVPLLTEPGNHDYWLLGTPDLKASEDQYANGFTQYYGQDVYAGKVNTSMPYNFSVDPSHEQPTDAKNVFQYKVVGNVGFIGYSAVYSWDSQLSMFEEACTYMGDQHPDWLFLIGHWSGCNDGCVSDPDMDVPATYGRVKELPGCNIPTLKNMYGHTHCNKKFSDHEFEIGGTGFLAECAAAGFVYLTTTNDRLQLVLFKYGDDSLYHQLTDCISTNHNLEGCMHLGEVWFNATAASHYN